MGKSFMQTRRRANVSGWCGTFRLMCVFQVWSEPWSRMKAYQDGAWDAIGWEEGGVAERRTLI
jgi:hypothetical protein